ncbi:MAG: SM-20-related protein [Myxococcota bacterium]|jgi:SM-20-related protein
MLTEDGVPSPLVPTISEADVFALGRGEAVVIDDVMPPAAAARHHAAIGLLHEQGALNPALVGRKRRYQPELRGDWTCWLEAAEDAPTLQGLWLWWDLLREEIRQAARLPLARFSVQLAHYPTGSQYVRHRDAIPGDPNRRLTAVLYLNADWQPAHGGQLRVWEPGGCRDIAPVAGRLVLFLSTALYHAVLPTTAPRAAVTAWFRGAEPIPLLPDRPLSAPGRG